jgi:hypothetical protein
MIAVAGAMGLALSASAAPAVPGTATPHDGNIVTVAGGCGPGFHPTPMGHCVPFRHFYGGMRYHSRGDFSAEDLNARELNRLNRY